MLACPFRDSSGAAGCLVRMNWRRTSSSASRIWRACTLQAMATTAPASAEAPSPNKAATTGWLVPAAAASMSSP